MDFSKLKRVELQRLAKKNGIKANQKTEKLIKALKKALNIEDESKSQEEADFLVTFLSEDESSEMSSDQSANASGGSKTRERTKKSNSALISSEQNSSVASLEVETLSSISPPWEDADSGCFDDTSKENKGEVKAEEILKPSRRTRSSSRNRSDKDKDQKEKAATPHRHKPKVEREKTLSVPKKRVASRVTDKENPPNRRKRKSQDKDLNSNKENQSKKSDWRDNMEQVLASVEQKLGRPSQLRGGKTMFAASGMTLNKSTSKSPGKGLFNKSHSKAFGKLESIDDYQKRKDERAEMLLGSGRTRQVLSRLAKPKTPASLTSNRPKPNISTPGSKRKNIAMRKPSLKSTSHFKPSVMSTSKINTNFSTKPSKLITPKKISVTFAKTPIKAPTIPESTPKNKRPTRSSLTPFRPIGVTNTPSSTKRNAFNLQESLKKPLTWVPHKGPIKTYQDTTKKPFQDRMRNVKNPPKVETRNKRRMENRAARSNVRSDQMMRRRGIK